MNFPTSPTAGDLFTINNVTYKYNNPGWEIHRTTADTITTDCGVIPFAGQSAVPAAIAGKAQLYGRTTPGAIGPVVLCHFEDDVSDSSGNGIVGSDSNISFADSGAGSGSSGFSRSAVFNGSNSRIDFAHDAFDLGTDDFTIEFWVKWSGQSHAGILSTHGDNANYPGSYSLWLFGTWMRIRQNDGNVSGGVQHASPTVYNMSTGNWYHFAFVREGTDFRVYHGLAGASTGSHIFGFTTAAAYHWGMSGSNGTVYLGSMSSGLYPFSGQLDEFRIIKDASIYTGTGSYDLPTVPFTVPSPTTKIYAMNSDGVESPLT